MKRFTSILFLGAATVAVASAQNESPTASPITRDGAYWVRTFQGTVDAQSTGQLRVETTGNVTLHGAAAGQVMYKLTARVKAADSHEAEALLQRIIVKTTTERGWTYVRVTPPRTGSAGLELTVNGPRTLRQVAAETRGGDVQASGWDGELQARSAGGQISVDDIRGRSELRTAGGDIQVGKVTGPVRCYSGGGAIRVENAGGEVWVETAGGEISVRQAGGPLHASTGGGNIRVERAASTVFARTSGGLIQVEQASGAVTAESAGGAIQVNSASGVRCESAGGAIRLQNVSGALHASTSAGSIMAELASGQPTLGRGMADSILSTSAGDITVSIPSNLALTIQAMNESGGSGRIVSDFTQLRPSSGGPQGAGPVVAQGMLNGGGPVLRVNVIGGTIYLRRAK